MATSLDRKGKTRTIVVDAALRVAIGSAATWLLYRASGPLGLVFAAPLWGVLMAGPMLELAQMLVSDIKRSAAGSGGDVVPFDSHQLRVRNVAGFPWIVDSDLLAAVGETPSEAQRRRADPAHCAPLPGGKLWGYSEAGVVKVLSSSRHPDAIRLRLVLERQVFFPARKKREVAASARGS